MIKNLLLLIFLLSFFSSCFSSRKTTESMKVWLGEKKHNLIMSYGPPDKISEDGAGGEVLVYITNYYTPVTSTSPANTLSNAQQFKMYFINPEGIIYHCLVKNQQIAPTQVEVIRQP
jgi:hypothetical protein